MTSVYHNATMGKKILVISSDESERASIVRYLQGEKYHVMHLGSSEAAILVMDSFVPDLILTDVGVERRAGIRLFKRLRDNPRWSDIPFLFLASTHLPADILETHGLGQVDFLICPVGYRALIDAVRDRLSASANGNNGRNGGIYYEVVKALAGVIGARDPYTRDHADRVGEMACWMARVLGWSEERIRVLEYGAQLHDIGKLIVPDHVLKKNAKLTEDEWNLMRQHPEAGEKILMNISHLRSVRPYVLCHHERWDGSGYPGGLVQDEIPIEARLLAIVDVFDALTTDRVYRPAWSRKAAIEYITERAGIKFDPSLVHVFCKVLQM